MINKMKTAKCGKTKKEWYYFQLKLSSQNDEKDDELRLDNNTWRQFIYNAMKRSHGLFGEAIEYYFLSQQDKIAYVKVNYKDKDTFFFWAIFVYFSDELVGIPLVATIITETDQLENFKVCEDDEIWLKRAIEECGDDSECH